MSSRHREIAAAVLLVNASVSRVLFDYVFGSTLRRLSANSMKALPK